MDKENLTKKSIDLSPFLRDLYRIKFELENIIIELEKMKNVQ